MKVETKIMKVNEKDYVVPKFFNRGQLQLLTLIWPGPLGYGLRINAAAKLLGISPKAAYGKIETIKKRFPEIIENYKIALKTRTRQINNSEMTKSLGFAGRDDSGYFGGDVLEWLDEESNSSNPSEEAKQFGLIREVF